MATYIALHTLSAVICHYISHCAKHDLPWLKINPLITAIIGLVFGYIGILGVLLYIFYDITKQRRRYK